MICFQSMLVFRIFTKYLFLITIPLFCWAHSYLYSSYWLCQETLFESGSFTTQHAKALSNSHPYLLDYKSLGKIISRITQNQWNLWHLWWYYLLNKLALNDRPLFISTTIVYYLTCPIVTSCSTLLILANRNKHRDGAAEDLEVKWTIVRNEI